MHKNVWQSGPMYNIAPCPTSSYSPRQNIHVYGMCCHVCISNCTKVMFVDYECVCRLCGSYEALKSGCVGDALHDFTAGLVECYNIHDEPPPPTNIINILFKALEKQTLITASTSVRLFQSYKEQCKNIRLHRQTFQNCCHFCYV